MTSGLAHVQRFSGLTRNLQKFSSAVQSLSAAQWVKFGGTGYDVAIQLHTSHPHGESPSQMAAAASHK